MIDIKDLKIRDITPESIRDLPPISDTAEAAQQFYDEWIAQVEGNAGVSNLDSVTGLQLDYLAWQFGADVWRDVWPDDIKRNVLRNIVASKRIKGTRRAVSNAIARLGSAATITEWWEETPPATPHTFKIDVSVADIPGQATEDVQKDIQRAIDAAKPVRSSYEMILGVNVPGEWGLYGAARPVVLSGFIGKTNETGV